MDTIILIIIIINIILLLIIIINYSQKRKTVRKGIRGKQGDEVSYLREFRASLIGGQVTLAREVHKPAKCFARNSVRIHCRRRNKGDTARLAARGKGKQELSAVTLQDKAFVNPQTMGQNKIVRERMELQLSRSERTTDADEILHTKQ